MPASMESPTISTLKSEPAMDIQPREPDELASDYEMEVDDEVDSKFKPHEPLEPPVASSLSCQQLYDLVDSGEIDISPDYQRDVVWNQKGCINLVDSIFRNFYIPPLLFAMGRSEEGDVIRKCMDGKQRISAIKKFMAGEVPYRDRDGKKYYYHVPHEQRGRRLELPPAWKNFFAAKLMTIVEYRVLTAEAEHDIFQRVQLGMPLTTGEKLQAITSSRRDWIVSLQAQFVLADDGLAKVIDWNTKRGRDFQNLAELVYACDCVPKKRIKPTKNKVDEWLRKPAPLSDDFKRKVTQVLTEMWHIASQKEFNAAFKEIKNVVAPVEFVFMGLLLFILQNYDYSTKAIALFNMRRHVRDVAKDVRSNDFVVKAIWHAINNCEYECRNGTLHKIKEGAWTGNNPHLVDVDE